MTASHLTLRDGLPARLVSDPTLATWTVGDVISINGGPSSLVERMTTIDGATTTEFAPKPVAIDLEIVRQAPTAMDALRCLVVADGLFEHDDIGDCADLYDRGLVRQGRDFTGETYVQLTEAGKRLVLEALPTPRSTSEDR